MRKLVNAFLILLSVCITNTVFSQDVTLNKFIQSVDTVRSKNLNSLKTDVLSEVLQTSIDNGIISSNETDIKLKTTIFGLKKLFNPNIIIDSNYALETFSRNFEIGAGLQLNNDSKINGFSTSLKYALINHRDVSVIDFNHLNSKLKELNDKINSQALDIVNDLSASFNDSVVAAVRRGSLKPDDPLIKQMHAFTGNIDDNKYEAMKQTLLAYNAAGKISIDTSIFSRYPQKKFLIDALAQEFENEIKKRSLLTWSFNSNYVDKKWDSILVGFEFVNGLGLTKDESKPWDIYASVFFNAKNDTTQQQSLHRQVGVAKLGLNKVLEKKANGSSFLEVLGAAEYDNIFNGRYENEKRSTLMADFTVTIRLTNSLFLPFEVKYDPYIKNFFGFINIKWDLLRTSLNK